MFTKKNTLTVICVSLLLSACAKSFDKIAYTDSDHEYEKLLVESIDDSGDYESKVLLGRFYFEHNELEKADELLESLIEEDENHMEALAWYGANKCKIVADSTPWLMGLRKLYRVNGCLNDVKTALDKGGDNFNIKLVGIHTGSGVNMFDSLEWASDAHEKLSQEIKEKPNKYAPEAIEYFHLASADYHKAAGDQPVAQKLLSEIIATSKNDKLIAQAKKMQSSFN